MPCPTVHRILKLAPPRVDAITAAHRLRYKVYCEEHGFIEPGHCPHDLDVDEYDGHSCHFVGIDDRGRIGGTLRIVRDSHAGFPLERHAGPGLPEIIGVDRTRTAEVSRLVLARHHRGRSVPARLMLYGLLGRMFEEARRMELTGLLAAMEPGLWRLLAKIDICFDAVGPQVSYFGPVRPYYAHLDSLDRGYKRILDYQETHAGVAGRGYRFFNVTGARPAVRP